MVNQASPSLDRLFAALADPTRRALIADLAALSPRSITQLAKPLPMSLPAVMKHLDVLESAGLIAREKVGRTVLCRLTAAPMRPGLEWLETYARFWSESLDRLAAAVEKQG